MSWNRTATAANGTDQGCLEIDFDRLPAAIEGLERTVLQIKSQADAPGSERLKARFVDAHDEFASLKTTLTSRWLRAPKATFVYSLSF